MDWHQFVDFNSLLIGLDVGTVNSCVVVNHKREFLPLTDDHGKKRIPTCVTLTNKDRILGSLSRDCLKDYYETTWFDFKQFIGQVFSQNEARRIAEKVPYNIHTAESVGPLQFPTTFLGKNFQFSPEQLLVMHLKHLCQLIYERYSSTNLSCVIGVPICYTEAKTDALISACELSNMKNVKLLKETTAIAMAYTFLVSNLPSSSEASRNVAFISIGYMHTQVAVCSFNQNRARIRATSSDADLGGYQFDQVIYNWLCENLKEHFNRELSSDEKRQCLAWLAAENLTVKKSLDHETNRIQIKIESLFSSDDITLTLPRQTFKERCQDLLERLRKTIEDSILASQLGINDIHSVEVLGGTCRIMEVKETINNVFAKQCRWTLSSEEAVAMGCALHAAKHRLKLEVLESTGALSEEVKNKYNQIEEEISEMESELRKLQEQHYQLETYIYSLIDGADEFSWIFNDERDSYRERLEKNRESMRLDNVELTGELLDRIRRSVDDERQALKDLDEQRKAWIENWLKISQQLTVEGQDPSGPIQSAEGYVSDLEQNLWNPQKFLAVLQMKTWVQSSPSAIESLLRSIDETQKPVTTRTTSPIFTDLVERVKKSVQDVSNEIQREMDSLMTSLSVVNKQVFYLLSFEQTCIKMWSSKPTNLQGLKNSVNHWKEDTDRLTKEIAAVQRIHPSQVDTRQAPVESTEHGEGYAGINVFASNSLPQTRTGSSGSAVKDMDLVDTRQAPVESTEHGEGYAGINVFASNSLPQTRTGSSGSAVKDMDLSQWIKTIKDVLKKTENFSKCWNEFSEVFNELYTPKVIKQRIQNLEAACAAMQTADYGFEDFMLDSMSETQRRAYKAAQLHRDQTHNVMDRVTALLDSTVESFLNCYSERCTATMSCSFPYNEEQLNKFKTSLENIKSKQASYMGLENDIKNTLSEYAAELPGYQQLLQETQPIVVYTNSS